MDWSSAKNILISIFLALNIFLFIVLKNIYFSGGIPDNVIENTKKMLKASNITVNCDIPLYNGKYQIMTTHKDTSIFDNVVRALIKNDEKIIKELHAGKKVDYEGKVAFLNDADCLEYRYSGVKENNIPLKNSSVIKVAQKFINKAALNKDNYILEEIKLLSSGKYKVIYAQKYNEFLLFNNSLTLFISSEGVDRFMMCNRAPENASFRNSQVKNAYEVLLEHYIKKRNITITHIDMGFKEENDVTTNEKIHTLRMVWRITTNDGARLFFHALDGAQLK